MKLSEILNTDYIGKFIYREDWDKYYYTSHKAIKLALTSASLVYVPNSINEEIEIMEHEYKFSLYEMLCNDWRFYED